MRIFILSVYAEAISSRQRFKLACFGASIKSVSIRSHQVETRHPFGPLRPILDNFEIQGITANKNTLPPAALARLHAVSVTVRFHLMVQSCYHHDPLENWHHEKLGASGPLMCFQSGQCDCTSFAVHMPDFIQRPYTFDRRFQICSGIQVH